MKYVVKIEERLSRMVTIEAQSEKEAEAKAEQLYNAAKIVLDIDDFEGAPHITCYGSAHARPDLAAQALQKFE